MEVLFVIVPILVVVIFGFTFVMMFSSKLRGKMLANQIKSMKVMVDESKDVIADLSSTVIGVNKKVLDENEDTLRDMSTKGASIKKDAIKMTARAIKEGLAGDDGMFCKHCGASIDGDSTFCKKCGKKQ